MSSLSRRRFFTFLTAGIFHVLTGNSQRGQAKSAVFLEKSPDSTAPEKDLKIKTYNPLGKTGIITSDIMFGAGIIHSPELVRYAYDLGVTAFDTAEDYTSGVSEKIIGQGLEGIRDKTCIITKQRFNLRRKITETSIIKRLEKSLKSLKTDYVDGLFIHSMDSRDFLKQDAILNAYSRLKKDGKVRFTGFSTHKEIITFAQCLKPEYEGFVDAVMFCYNHMEGRKIEPLIEKLHQKGIGTIAMKTLAGGKHGRLKEFVNDRISYPQAAIGWVLANKNIDAAVMSMDNFSLIDAYVAASGKRIGRNDMALLKKYRNRVDSDYCRHSCSACEQTCPENVAISDIMRFSMYYKDYGQKDKARLQYSTLKLAQKPILCRTCSGACTQACPYGLRVQKQLLRIHSLLTS